MCLHCSPSRCLASCQHSSRVLTTQHLSMTSPRLQLKQLPCHHATAANTTHNSSSSSILRLSAPGQQLTLQQPCRGVTATPQRHLPWKAAGTALTRLPASRAMQPGAPWCSSTGRTHLTLHVHQQWRVAAP